eukprot:COSAG04_NODE_135_length_23774_cov_40.993918_9_plen_219_part_00
MSSNLKWKENMKTKRTSHNFDKKRLDGRKDDLTEYFKAFAEWANKVKESTGIHLIDPSASRKGKKSSSSGDWNECDKDRVIPTFFMEGESYDPLRASVRVLRSTATAVADRENGRVTVMVQPGSGKLGLEWGEGAASFPVVQSIQPGSLFDTDCPEVLPGMRLSKLEGDIGSKLVSQLGRNEPDKGFAKVGRLLMQAGLTQQGLTNTKTPLVLQFSSK